MAKEKKVKPPKVKKEKIKKEKAPGRGRTAIAVIAFVLALASLAGGAYFGYGQWNTAKQAATLAEQNEANDKRIAALEDAASAEKNRERVAIQMEPHALAAYMADSAYLYRTRFSSARYEAGDASALVKLRVPVTVTIYNNSDQTITVKGAALYPWETIFDETARQEALAARQEKGFFGEITQGQREGFSIAPGDSQTMEIDARLRGVYGHPALEAETHRFFMSYFGSPDAVIPDPGNDIRIDGKGTMNGQVNYLLREALDFYCAQRSTRFTLTYVIETARGNRFFATCIVPF